MKNRSITFRIDARKEAGIGHLIRSINLGEYFKSKGCRVNYIIKGNQHRQPEIDATYISKTNGFSSELKILDGLAHHDIIVCDFINQITLEEDGLGGYLEKLNSYFQYSIFFDGIYSDSVFSKISWPAIDQLITPYLTSFETAFPNKLVGPEYFVFSDSMIKASYNKSFDLKRIGILISFGGSDPCNLTRFLLQTIEPDLQSFKYIDFFVVVGPYFSKVNLEAIDTISSIHENIQIIHKPTDLTNLFAKSSIAITNGGLTKYEASLFGCTIIQINENQTVTEINSDFAQAAGGVFFGEYKYINPIELRRSLHFVINDNEFRKSCFYRNRSIVDGKGKERIYQRLTSLK